MVETQLHPSDGAVALVAFLPIATSMLVVIFVTGKTSLALCVILEIATVARITASPPMFPFEWKIGLVVIEVRLFPILGGMARVTLITVATEVNVVEAVAGNAGRRCVLVALVGMA